VIFSHFPYRSIDYRGFMPWGIHPMVYLSQEQFIPRGFHPTKVLYEGNSSQGHLSNLALIACSINLRGATILKLILGGGYISDMFKLPLGE